MASVRRDHKANRIVVRAYGGTDPVTGKARQPSRTLPSDATDEEIQRAEDDVDLRAGLAKRMGARCTIGALVDYYLDSCIDYGMSPTSVSSYRSNARCYVHPFVGNLAFSKASAADFSSLYLRLIRVGGKDGSPVSQSTVKKFHAFLSGCFSSLMQDGIVDRNPVAGVKVPTGVPPEAEPLSERDFAVLVSYLSETLSRPAGAVPIKERTMAAALWTDLHTGVRRGELAAFRMFNLRRKPAPELRVTHSLAEVKGMQEPVFYKEPKSTTSKRGMTIDPVTDTIIEDHVAMQASMLASFGIKQDASTPLFARPDGKPYRPSQYTDAFRALKVRLGLGAYARLHTLRHTHATYLLEQGTNIKTVQERLGHSKIDVTLNIYGHVLPGRDEKAAHDFGEVSKNMMQQACIASGTSLVPKCPLSGETCARFI